MISLVIPTFNRGDLIAQTIESALSQSAPFSEIIVVDDGSTDNTAEVLAKFGNQLKIFRTANQGVQAARNTGVEAAQGEYITLCDSDDLFENTFVEVMSSWLTAHADIDIAYVNFRTFNGAAVSENKFSQAPPGWFEGAQRDSEAADRGFCWNLPDLYLRTVQFQPLFPTGATFRRSFYKKIGGFDARFNGVGGEDWEFTLRAIAAGQVALCKQPLAKVRKHSGNDSANLVRQLLGEAQILFHALAHHQITPGHVSAMQESMEARRLAAFDHAYATGNFKQASKVVPLLSAANKTATFKLKKLILALPSGLRRLLWKATQR